MIFLRFGSATHGFFLCSLAGRLQRQVHRGVGEQRGGVALLLGQGRNTSGHILSSRLRLTGSHWFGWRRDLIVAGGPGFLHAAAWYIVDLVENKPAPSVHIWSFTTIKFRIDNGFRRYAIKYISLAIKYDFPRSGIPVWHCVCVNERDMSERVR